MKYRRLSRKKIAVGTTFTWKDREGDFCLPHMVVLEHDGDLFCRIKHHYQDGSWAFSPFSDLLNVRSLLTKIGNRSLYLVTGIP